MGEQLLGSPRPGHGRVFVLCDRHGEWSASWQDDYPDDEVGDGEPDAGVEDFEGTQDEVIRWARTRPAEKFFIFSDEAHAYLPLAPADAAELPASAEHRYVTVRAGSKQTVIPSPRHPWLTRVDCRPAGQRARPVRPGHGPGRAIRPAQAAHWPTRPACGRCAAAAWRLPPRWAGRGWLGTGACMPGSSKYENELLYCVPMRYRVRLH
jgi:hypothetical protein